jgi:hypothetical protein
MNTTAPDPVSSWPVKNATDPNRRSVPTTRHR